MALSSRSMVLLPISITNLMRETKKEMMDDDIEKMLEPLLVVVVGGRGKYFTPPPIVQESSTLPHTIVKQQPYCYKNYPPLVSRCAQVLLPLLYLSCHVDSIRSLAGVRSLYAGSADSPRHMPSQRTPISCNGSLPRNPHQSIPLTLCAQESEGSLHVSTNQPISRTRRGRTDCTHTG